MKKNEKGTSVIPNIRIIKYVEPIKKKRKFDQVQDYEEMDRADFSETGQPKKRDLVSMYKLLQSKPADTKENEQAITALQQTLKI